MSEFPPLRGLDLNLLVTLRALLRTANVTLAAEVLGQTQPTVSRALATLRVAFDDPLLVRAGRGMARTPLAEALRPRLETALEALDVLPRVGAFDPSTARRTWRVVSPDVVAVALQPAVLAHLEAVAPFVVVEFVPYEDAQRLLLDHRADLGVGALFEHDELHIHLLPPCRLGWSVVFNVDHSLAHDELTLERWLACRHVEVGAGVGASQLDAQLDAQGLRRFVAAHLPTMSGLAESVAHTHLVASLPTPIARRLAQDVRLEARPHPLTSTLAPLHVSLAWHTLHEDDPGHRWFRAQLLALLQQLLTSS